MAQSVWLQFKGKYFYPKLELYIQTTEKAVTDWKWQTNKQQQQITEKQQQQQQNGYRFWTTACQVQWINLWNTKNCSGM